MVPWAGSPTASFSVTLALAAVTFLTGLLSGMKQFGVIGFFLNQVPPIDMPTYMLPLKIIISFGLFLIEILGLCIKHLILAVRLLANMVAGHLVLLGIMGLITAAASASTGTWATVTVISVLSATLFSVLELFVAFLQAYIFTFLSALFVGVFAQFRAGDLAPVNRIRPVGEPKGAQVGPHGGQRIVLTDTRTAVDLLDEFGRAAQFVLRAAAPVDVARAR